MRFYIPKQNGELEECTNPKIFIDTYSLVYMSQVPYSLEQKIDDILAKDSYEICDVKTLFRWKFGHYNTNDFLAEIKIPRTEFVIDDNICRNIVNLKLAYTNKMITEQEIYEELLTINGLGAVYLLTVLFFITKQISPIYDSFADLALRTIKDEVEFCDYQKLSRRDAPDKNYIKAVFARRDEYKRWLEEVFGKDAYKTNRNIDKALWAYGHFVNCNANYGVKVNGKP